ncbi:hypothetical protein XM47_17220 [Catenovulum maritimum]|uniref:TonB-dependent receptor n=2 Tax=Catenovulum maritimum TaxID=1513271 RepID=A0A0J8JHK8_9ALTE|nr:hypothetical protein XM47_17220 [Catenovulum maritimum]
MTKPTNTFKNANLRPNKLALALAAAGLMFSVSGSVVAAEKARLTAKEKQAQQEEVEKIQVTGVRGALETALNTKREALSIVDAISATDIDALPALDFGEALQAIPGVQLDRSSEGRQSEISLRGLSGGFVKTTAMGQSFATPSRSFGPTGGTNPFAAFEAGVFDGVTVVKTPTADIQAGGMAGVVDKKLQKALSKKDGKYSVSLGGRYEELTGNWDKSIKLSAAKHLIKDELAVAFKFSGSEQTFRRDLVQTAVHVPLVNTGRLGQASSDTIGAYIDKYNIPEGSVLKGVSNLRNVSEYSDGDRVSFTGNVEWKPIENLKLGAHVLYTERDLGAGTKEDAQIDAGIHRSNRNHGRDSRIEPDMDTAPFIYKTDEDGVDHYMVSNVHFTNGYYGFTNRKTTFLETSKGLFLYADYATDDWAIDANFNQSESENQFMNIGIEMAHNQHHSNTSNHKAAGETSNTAFPAVPTGIDGQISTGQGNMEDIIGQFTGWETYNYDNLNWNTPTVTSPTITSYDPSNDGRRVQFRVNGRVDTPIRDMSAAEFNAERYTEFGFGDAFNVSSIKFGSRYSKETLVNDDHRVSISGVDLANVSGGLVKDTLLTAEQTAFFDGKVPNTFGQNSGWQTFSNDEAAAILQTNLADLSTASETNPYPVEIIPPSGFYERINNNTKLPEFYQNNFDVDQEIKAAYVMANFTGDLDAISYTGNFGVRYEETTNSFLGARTEVIEEGGKELALSQIEYETDYANVLPSFNLSLDFLDDFVLRTAYFKALVRPNLRSQNPTLAINEGNTNITVNLPAAELEPYTADNYDLSLEWYNREGSAVSIGVFKKVITDLFLTENPCPSLGEYTYLDDQFGGFVGEDSEDQGSCLQIAEYTHPETGEVGNRSLRLTRKYNADNEIKLTGIEFALQQKLDFLPYPWNGFGGVFNYTYIDQTGDEGDNKLYKVSPRSYNLIGYWENDGLSLRLAYNWRDSFDIQSSNTYYGIEDKKTKASGRLDFSGSYKVSKGLTFYLKGYNITNEQVYEYFGNDERAMARIDYTGRIVEASLNYSF